MIINKIKLEMRNNFNFFKLIFFTWLLAICYENDLAKAQEEDITNLRTTSALFGVKGGSSSSLSSKTSSGISKFKQTITNIQRQQQQAPIVLQQNFRSSVSSNSIVERPAPVVIEQTSSRQVVEQQQSTSNNQQELTEEVVSNNNPEPAVYGSVSGAPGIDFPNYTNIPNTKFSCDGVPFDPGMYADESTGCQVYHLCYQGRKESFLCGVGTVFNQAIMNCDFWSSVECSKSSKYYQLNADFGKSSSEPGSGGIQQQKVSSSSFVRESQVVVAPPPPVQTKTSFVERKEQTIVNQPVRLISRVESSSSSGGQTFTSGVKGGKASAPRKSFSSIEEIRRASGGFVSPGKRLQFLQNQEQNVDQLASNEAQLASGSSNRFKMASSSVSMELPVISAGGTDSKEGGRKVGSKSAKGGATRTGNEVQIEVPRAPVNNVDGNSEWRPYFKSNSTTTTTTSSKPEPAPVETTTLPPPADQEPTFSDNKEIPKSGAPPEAGSTSPTSIESDVGPDLTTTTPAASSSEPPSSPPPETTTTSTTTVMMDLDKSSPAPEASSSASSEGHSDSASGEAPSTTVTPAGGNSSSSPPEEREVEGSDRQTSSSSSSSSSGAAAKESSVEYAKEKDAQSLSSAKPETMTTAPSESPESSGSTAAEETGSGKKRRRRRRKKKRDNKEAASREKK